MHRDRMDIMDVQCHSNDGQRKCELPGRGTYQSLVSPELDENEFAGRSQLSVGHFPGTRSVESFGARERAVAPCHVTIPYVVRYTEQHTCAL
jgi:hypothetical protein